MNEQAINATEMSAKDQLRLQNSILASFATHVAIFILYLILKTAAPAPDLLISNVEFIEFEEENLEQQEKELPVAMRVPTTFKDLLKMALPQPKPTQPAEPQPQDIQTPAFDQIQTMTARQPTFKIDDRTLEARSQIRLKLAPTAKPTSSPFSEISKNRQATTEADLSMINSTPDIDIEAVGRRAVANMPSASIRLDPTAKVAKSGFADIKTVSRSIARGPATSADNRGIQLKDTEPIRRSRGRLPTGSLPIGYGKGSGGISLKTSPIENKRTRKVPKEITQSAKPMAALIPETPGKNKSVEISGPLAHRKVVNYQLPKYPGWARDKGIEAEVVIRFFVSNAGYVRDRQILERTSGYPELDKISMQALKKWLFAAMPAERAQEGDQWGTITFRFRLK